MLLANYGFWIILYANHSNLGQLLILLFVSVIQKHDTHPLPVSRQWHHRRYPIPQSPKLKKMRNWRKLKKLCFCIFHLEEWVLKIWRKGILLQNNLATSCCNHICNEALCRWRITINFIVLNTFSTFLPYFSALNRLMIISFYFIFYTVCIKWPIWRSMILNKVTILLNICFASVSLIWI